MGDTPYFVTLDEALDICKKTTLQNSVDTVHLDSAHNRILATDLKSLVDDPPFDNSAMDGFAMRHKDTLNPPTNLKIIGTIQASGDQENITVSEGETVRIMTGAPMPSGADSILQVELTSCSGETLTISQESMPGYVRKKGENIRKGDTILSKGTVLTPSNISMVATMGYNKIPVFRKLVIGIIPTGNELKQPGEDLQPGEIFESNAYGISGLVKWLGHTPKRYDLVEDTMDKTRESLDRASKECDLIITSGGVSMGDWDLIRKIMEEEGDIHFWRIKLRPGSPPLFGKWKDTPIFGLPGNPVSSHVVFRMLVAPWIRNLTSSFEPVESRAFATLATNVKPSKDFLTLRRVKIESDGNQLKAYQETHQGSGNIASMALSNALAMLKPNTDYSIGDIVEILYI